ncbi:MULTISPECIES: LysR family transcriptional regulator [Burkholderia]|uniref:LysR family transcriptional regulator n=1 Tax=Burkholderia TaxID=32008 RepID=UPI001589C3D8|nr:MULTISPECIES: LysR family transcriptional regulator [Burkholderia]MBR8161485.1 LysR family transcriptional regulator [Burkholderia vietnamiensis]MCA8149960.1 LysR family transcriptional regulator [Burkholderia vietnamiensis]MDN8039911.1 LysR family transcriptional regulator [Burkholderia vietnamiensis]HDR8944993.1 LysR family transcriptional regulator [Burkholderia vietnamiensis]HDR9129001.1 LysR family transcriptional regulator [Burkholderia vietnamiensis]
MQGRKGANTLARSLDIDLLRSFVVIAEVRSLSRAAARVGRTQSALSQQMRRLEESVDQPLFQRTGRGVVLTHPGERLLLHAQRILRQHDEALADLCGTGLSGTIRFGCPDDYAQVWLPSLLRQFSSHHPHAIVEVVCGPTPRLLEQLDKRAVDLAMISVPDEAATDDFIRREQLVWIGYPGLDTAQFERLPLALSDPDTLDHIAACDALARAGRDYRVAYASSSLAGLIALVRSGQAIAVMTQTAVPADLAILAADRGLPPLPAVGITLRFDRKRPSHLTAVFAEHIRAVLPLL